MRSHIMAILAAIMLTSPAGAQTPAPDALTTAWLECQLPSSQNPNVRERTAGKPWAPGYEGCAVVQKKWVESPQGQQSAVDKVRRDQGRKAIEDALK